MKPWHSLVIWQFMQLFAAANLVINGITGNTTRFVFHAAFLFLFTWFYQQAAKLSVKEKE